MKICPQCGSGFDDYPKFCARCGAKLPDAILNAVQISEEGITEVLPPDLPETETVPEMELHPEEPASIANVAPAAEPLMETPLSSGTRGSKRHIWRMICLAAMALVLLLSFIWGIAFIKDLLNRGFSRQKDAVAVLESDNDELVGISRSGRLVKYKTEKGIRRTCLSSDGSKMVLIDEESGLILFDGSRFSRVAEDVQEVKFSFDGSALAYTNGEGELYLYRSGNPRRIASQVFSSFCLSPDGKAVAYARMDGEDSKAFYYNGREREIAKDALPLALSNGGSIIYYYSSKGVLYAQTGSNIDSRQKLVDQAVEICFNKSGTQVLVFDGTNTYFSENARERSKITAQRLSLLPPQNLAMGSDYFCGLNNLKNQYYTTMGDGGETIFLLNGRLELSSLIKNTISPQLQPDGHTLIYSKNQNLYWIDLRNAEGRENKLADKHKGFLVSGDGKHLLYLNEEGETWFAKLGGSSRRVTADTLDMESEVRALENSFIYVLEGSLYYTNGGKGSKISGLSDDVQSLSGSGFWILAECKNGEVFLSTNGRSFKKCTRK